MPSNKSTATFDGSLVDQVAALHGADLLSFERKAKARRAVLLSDEHVDAELHERTKGKFAAPVQAARVKPVSIDWLWSEYLPLGALSLLYGPEGDGKSTLSMMLAAMVTRGTLPGSLFGTPSTVEIVAYEDDAAAVLVPRLLAAGADLDRVFIHGTDAGDAPLTLPDDVPAFSAALKDRGSRLVIVDPLPDALREGLKDNNNADVRKGIVPLHRMAQDLGLAVLGITHPNKGATDAANKVMGSKAWRSVPRSVLIYGRDPDDLNGSTRVVAVSKANYGGKAASKVNIESVTVENVEGTQPRATLVGRSDYTDADLILANAGAGRSEPITGRGGQLAKATHLIFRLLEDGGGEIDAKVAYAAGAADAIPEATMKRARKDMGVIGGRTWTLPDTGLSVS